VAQAEQKVKGKKVLKTPAKATVKVMKAAAKVTKTRKATMKATMKATRAVLSGDKEDPELGIVEDDTSIKCVCSILGTF